jgi:hypothetical protein
MRRVFAAVLVAATTLIGGGAVSPLSAAATALPVGRLETNPARAELIQYGRRDDDGWGRRRGRDGGWDHRRDRYDDDDYDRPRRWYPRRHYGGATASIRVACATGASAASGRITAGAGARFGCAESSTGSARRPDIETCSRRRAVHPPGALRAEASVCRRNQPNGRAQSKHCALSFS